MVNQGTVGILVVSVDLEPSIEQRVKFDAQKVAATGKQILGLLARYNVPATWSLFDPGRSKAPRAILSGMVEHEIAVAGDQSWVGEGAGRTRFARELSRRVSGARSVGLPASTITLRNAELGENHDLLVKHDISMIRPGKVTGASNASESKPCPIRYGVWQLPAHFQFPGKRHWLPGGTVASARKAIQRAVAGKQVLHLTIDIPQLAKTGQSGIQGLDWILREAYVKRQHGILQFATLGEVAESLKAPRQRGHTKSILRRAA